MTIVKMFLLCYNFYSKVGLQMKEIRKFVEIKKFMTKKNLIVLGLLVMGITAFSIYLLLGTKTFGLNPNDIVPLEEYNYAQTISNAPTKTLKVLILELDPILTKGTVSGVSCAGKNASVCLGQNKEQAISELVTDIEYSSHGTIDVDIVETIKTNEFATYKNNLTLPSGIVTKTIDEDTWLSIFNNGWFGFWDNEFVKTIPAYSLDYEYLVNKFNLTAKRAAGEFDQVWLVNVDVTQGFESIMVGKTAYWINGAQLINNSINYKIINVSISRPDANFECNAHATENILSNVFNSISNSCYDLNHSSITVNNYDTLNLWDKFTLNERSNATKGTGLSGVGNVHFSPNSETDYDWANTTNNVLSKWKEWENYPNLTSTASLTYFNPTTAYLNSPLTGTISDARKHHRWWFSLMPHVTGYTNDGYSNNWWDYITNGDYVTSISPKAETYSYVIGDVINNIQFTLTKHSTLIENSTLTKYSNNISVSNETIFGVNSNTELVATSPGTSTLTFYRDGKEATVNIIVNSLVVSPAAVKTEVGRGQNFDVSISVDMNESDFDIYKIIGKINYDTTKFTLNSAVMNADLIPTNVIEQWDEISNPKTNADNIFSIANLQYQNPITSDKAIYTLNFSVKSNASFGSSTISTSNLTVSGADGESLGAISGSINIDVVSSDANLSNLSITEYSLTPTFSSQTTSYSINVNSNVSSITINGTKSDTNASVTGTGVKTLSYGTNTFNIVVTAADGVTTKTYTIVVKKEEPIELVEESEYIIEDEYILIEEIGTGIDRATFVSNILTNLNNYNIYESDGETIAGNVIKTGQIIKVDMNDYYISIMGDTNGDGISNINDIMKIGRHLYQSDAKLIGPYEKAGNINKNTGIDFFDIMQLAVKMYGN